MRPVRTFFIVLSVFLAWDRTALAQLATPTKTLTSTPTVTSTATSNVPTATPICANQAVFGVTFVSNGAYLNEGVNQITANQAILPTAATITALSINVLTASNVINLAIYSDNGTGSAPGTLIVSSGPQTLFNNRDWNTVEIPPTDLAAGTYWLCYSGDSQGYPLVGLSNIGTRLTASAVGFPQNFPSSSSVQGSEAAIYMYFCQGTYTPQDTATVTSTATPTVTYTRTRTATPTVTGGGPIYTATLTATHTVTATPCVTETFTPGSAFTFTPSPTVTGGAVTQTWTFTPTPYGATQTQTPPCANQASFGVTTVGGGPYFNSGVNQITANQAVLPTSATITSLSINVETIGDNNMISLAIYSDDGTGTTPANLIVSSGPQTMFNNLGWNTVEISPTYLAAGTYWLCYSSDSNSYPLVGISGAGNRLIASAVGFPQNFPSSSSIQGTEAEIYASFCQGTYTPGATNTPIPTITLTPVLSFTATTTRTNTPVVSPTITVTPTATSTSTMTYTATMTYTHTLTPTLTVSSTMTNTPGMTYTKTLTPTVTITPCVTETPTPGSAFTYTPTITATPTVTGGIITQTATATHTNTITVTPTITATPTVTPTVTGGGPIFTSTLTYTKTVTYTPTITATPTVTGGIITQTATATHTNTITFTPTIIATPTVTSTVTGGGPVFTATLTYTKTYTFTPTITATFTPTPTLTATTVLSPSPTATTGPNPNANNGIPYPNPSKGGPIFFQVAGGPYDSVTLSIYTTGMRLIYFSPETLVNGGFSWNVLDKAGSQLSNGVYWAVIETIKGGVKARYTRKVLILR